MTPCPEPAAFLHLRLVSDYEGGERPVVLLKVTLARHERLAQLPVGTPVDLDFGLGPARRFLLFAAEPAPDATECAIAVERLDCPDAQSPSAPAGFFHELSGEAAPGSRLARDIEQLCGLLELRGNLQDMARASGGRLTNN